jgi:diaminopimelate epimerase
MKFVKMHGAGNDYVYVDCFSQLTPENLEDLARRISDRHFGVGADGLILIERSEIADAKMRMWNADGSFAEMCGNGIRCVAKYLIDSQIVNGPEITVETETGIRQLWADIQNGSVHSVRVEMGPPILSGEDIPTTLPGNPPVNESITVQSTEKEVTSVSMGNPHCVLFVEELTDRQVLGWGPILERHSKFPKRTNVEFVRVLSSREIELRVWERGSGETLACGTGACAAVVAGVLTGRTGRAVTCKLPGGELQVEWPEQGPVFLSGPAEEVFRGDWPSSRWLE